MVSPMVAQSPPTSPQDTMCSENSMFLRWESSAPEQQRTDEFDTLDLGVSLPIVHEGVSGGEHAQSHSRDDAPAPPGALKTHLAPGPNPGLQSSQQAKVGVAPKAVLKKCAPAAPMESGDPHSHGSRAQPMAPKDVHPTEQLEDVQRAARKFAMEEAQGKLPEKLSMPVAMGAHAV